MNTTITTHCPSCGANLTINVTASQPTSKKRLSAEAKLEALRDAGVNISNFFSMKGADGTETIARLENGTLSIVPEDDPVFASIMEGGTVPNAKLFRRWIMSQVFHMMVYRPYGQSDPIGFHEAVKHKGNRYAWKMATEEFRVQSVLYKNDRLEFSKRNWWFNKGVAIGMADHYLKSLAKHIDSLKPRKYKGIPYVRLTMGDVFVDDLRQRVYEPLDKKLYGIKRADTPASLYKAFRAFRLVAKKTWFDERCMAQVFIDAYKGAGAYYTMQNLLLFHGCGLKVDGKWLFDHKAMEHLDHIALIHKCEGWYLFGMLKQLVADNHLDIEKMMEEWRNK